MSLCAKVAQNPNISYVTYSGNKQVCVEGCLSTFLYIYHIKPSSLF